MKVRLMGTTDECAALVDELRAAARVQVVEVSPQYPSRDGGGLVRVYVEVRHGRVWRAGDPEPADVTAVVNGRDRRFERIAPDATGYRWRLAGTTSWWYWPELLRSFGELCEAVAR